MPIATSHPSSSSMQPNKSLSQSHSLQSSPPNAPNFLKPPPPPEKLKTPILKTMESSSSSSSHFTKPLRRTLVPTPSPHLPPCSSTPEVDKEENNLFLLNPFTKIISFESNFFSSLSSSFFKFVSMASSDDFFNQAEEETKENNIQGGAITRVPTRVTEGSGVLLRRFGFGFLGAVYVGLVMIAVMCVAVIMGVCLVQMWVEEPVILRESVYFDYTEVHPTAVFSLGGLQGSSSGAGGVPVGHTIYVSLVLLLPESDFNRRIGMFQVGAEIISNTGKIIAKSSQPCVLQFRSLPIRLMHTFIMGIPLLLGISSETQKITIPILRYMEGNQRTEAIRTILQPRAGTLSLPELYSTEILVNSHLPWRKELVRSWKWTFYVWASLYVYVMLLVMLVCCCKSSFFPQTTRTTHLGRRDWSMEVVTDPSVRVDHKEIPVSDAMKKWQEIKSRRKPLLSQEMFTDQTAGSSASSVTFPREDVSELVHDDFDGFGDDESVCL